MNSKITGDVPVPFGDVGHKGVMSVSVKTERGNILTKDYGFTVEEENGNVLNFDLIEHPELGISLLFGNQVFILKFWTEENLRQGLKVVLEAISKEVERRNSCG